MTGVDADEYEWGSSSFSLQMATDKGAPLNEALRYAAYSFLKL